MNIENESLEFKQSWRDEYLRDICAFANTKGGILKVGVNDKGEIVGVDNSKKLLEDIPNKVRNRLGIIAMVKSDSVNNKDVVEVTVEPSQMPVSFDGKFYIRSGSTTVELKGTDLLRTLLNKSGQSWETLPTDATIEDLDIPTIERFKKLAKQRLPELSSEDSVEKLLLNLDLMTKDGKITNAGVLLFGKAPQLKIHSPSSRVGRFKTPTEILDTVDAHGNLFQQLDTLFDAIKKHLSVKFVIKPQLEREEVWDYPLDAIREAIVNALIHRDYLDTADIQIKVYDDKIWFWNPGTLPEGISVENLKEEHYSKTRNKLIASVFYYANLIERWGTGTRRMVELCIKQGLPEPEFREEMGGFSVYFYKDIFTQENLRKMGLNERQIRAVMYVKDKGRITNKVYQEISSVSNKTAYLELSDLVEKGIFTTEGKGKTIVYLLQKSNEGNE